MTDWGRAQYEGQQYFIRKVAETKLRNPSISWERAELITRGLIQFEAQMELQKRIRV